MHIQCQYTGTGLAPRELKRSFSPTNQARAFPRMKGDLFVVAGIASTERRRLIFPWASLGRRFWNASPVTLVGFIWFYMSTVMTEQSKIQSV